MREIRFRAKDKFTKIFIYGDLLQTSSGIKICNKDGDYEVVPETVGQCTGVHDESEDEKEIYEGDKIKFKYESTEYIGIVKFEAGMFILACDDLLDSYISFLEIIDSDRDYWWIDGEIVGNIYEK